MVRTWALGGMGSEPVCSMNEGPVKTYKWEAKTLCLGLQVFRLQIIRTAALLKNIQNELHINYTPLPQTTPSTHAPG